MKKLLPDIKVCEPLDDNTIRLEFIDSETTRIVSPERFAHAAYFFAHFAFQGWNAAQLKEKSLTRRNIPEEGAVWIYGDGLKPGEIAASAGYLTLAYNVASDPNDSFTVERVAYVEQIVKRQLAEVAEY